MQASPSALSRAFEQGELSRDEYWAQMRGHHTALQQYSALLAQGELSALEIRADGLRVVFKDGLRMRFVPSDTRSVPSVTLNHGSYESAEIAALERLAGSARVVLDIGANAGFVALRLARCMRDPEATVHAFEPIPSTFAELEANCEMNGLHARVRTHALALGERAGEVTFYVPSFHGSVAASTQPLFGEQGNSEVKVRMSTLDEFAGEQKLSRIDLIKCDVEGAELFVLRGGMATLARTRPVLMLEMLRKWARIHGYHPNAILELLCPLGYRCFALEAGRLREYPSIDESTEPTNFFLLDPERHASQRALLETAAVAASTSRNPAVERSTALARSVRRHVLGMVHRASASHVGGCLSIADILAVLYSEILRVDAQAPRAAARDRFVLSKGHAAAALYAVLAERGFIAREWLEHYCEDGSPLAGHVVHHGVAGVEVSTGSLGHGLPVACGMALAGKRGATPYRVFALLSDGECDEGSTWEAALFAPHHQLDNLSVIVDYNKLQSFGRVSEVLGLEPFADKWRAFGWSVEVLDGHDHAALRTALGALPREAGKPTVILANTVKGKGVSFMENQLVWHYKAPDAEELRRALAEVNGAG